MFKPQFIPREKKFFGLFEKSAENASQAAVKFKSLIDSWSDVTERVREITELEQYGDTITHDIMNLLNHTFVTPFDREDIALLAHTLDDITDCIQTAADFMLIYRVKTPCERVRELADIIVQITVELERAIPKLHSHSNELKKILSHCVEINRLENVADKVYRSALAELFDDITDITEVIKWREIYEQMESATDRCEDVADVLEGLALKNG